MPPKRKKLGRPLGSKNKKTPVNNVNGKIETEDIKNQDVSPKVDSQDISEQETPKAETMLKTLTIARKAVHHCKECPKKFRFTNSFNEHLKNEHSNLSCSIACPKCTARCPNKSVLDEHILKVHERDTFKCPHCDKEFVRHAHVLRHMAQIGCDGKGISSFPCEICDAKFTRKDNLIVHLRLQHISVNAYSCKYCIYNTKNFSKLVRHWHIQHSETPQQFHCHHCGKTTGSRAAMTKHLEIHGDKKFSCEVCGYSTYTIEVMRRHVLTHVEDKPYKCSLCKQSYIQRVQLERHLEKHTGNMCVVCEKTFPSKARLTIHKREHMGLEKLFCPFRSCAFAKKEFSDQTSLDNHLKVHLEEKSHKCEVCSKKFHTEMNMRRHLGTHTLDRPRRCMYCVSARAYVRGEQLVRHVRKHHPAVFRGHLCHVRQVLGVHFGLERVKKSELESILNVLDAESDRILEGYSGSGVLYGGMQDQDDPPSVVQSTPIKKENGPLMTEEELTENLNKLLSQLIDKETLECFGWPEETVDVVLEKVIEHCGAKPADREKWTLVQRLRENAKHLFLYVVDDKTVARMLDTHTIDQIVKHILKQVTEDDNEPKLNEQ